MGDSGLCYCVSCQSRAIFSLLVEKGKPHEGYKTNKQTEFATVGLSRSVLLRLLSVASYFPFVS